ncbi:unnamed protein product [Trichogramma brassicae]|uniref:Uncharacterized protein n=1 Tax=Trichogramma brassicae TaxID=86971 RepID=A0A6H5I4I5_9HYME|nr:unnamed protein product [Trichogramma brassicae]
MSRGLPSLRHLLADVRDATARELRLVRLRERLTLRRYWLAAASLYCGACRVGRPSPREKLQRPMPAYYQCLLCLFARANLAGEPEPTTRIRI